MKPLIAMLILGSIIPQHQRPGPTFMGLLMPKRATPLFQRKHQTTSQSAAIKTPSGTRVTISAVAVRASVIGNRSLPWNKLSSSKLV
jgi:hypothetical protein